MRLQESLNILLFNFKWNRGGNGNHLESKLMLLYAKGLGKESILVYEIPCLYFLGQCTVENLVKNMLA
jgi:hypothetical protein